MNNHTLSDKIHRREFLQRSGKAAASLLLAGLGSTELLTAAGQSGPKIPIVKLNNGISMPMLGLGTMTLEGAKGAQCVADAISLGYRLLDTATIYRNEEAVGEGIAQSGIRRDELFITTKLWVSDSGYENAKKAFERSLNKLRMEYVDLYLIHRHRGDVQGSWKAMQELHAAGKIKAIGVSNFDVPQMEMLSADGGMKPALNQIETHAFFQQSAAQEALKKYGVQMEGWSPFAEGRNNLFADRTLAKIGTKHKKTNAQVTLRWLLQRGIVAIPRTSQKIHMIENLDIFDFELDASDLRSLAALDLNVTQFPEWG